MQYADLKLKAWEEKIFSKYLINVVLPVFLWPYNQTSLFF